QEQEGHGRRLANGHSPPPATKAVRPHGHRRSEYLPNRLTGVTGSGNPATRLSRGGTHLVQLLGDPHAGRTTARVARGDGPGDREHLADLRGERGVDGGELVIGEFVQADAPGLGG